MTEVSEEAAVSSREWEERFADRELSWLAFNERVLELAEDQTLPLLERVRFLSIFSSNLDEFFMVRVAGLKRRMATGLAVASAAGLHPRQILDGIEAKAQELTSRHANLFINEIQGQLDDEGISLVRFTDLSESEQNRLYKYFRRNIFPVLTPLAVDPAHPFPYISGLSLNLAVVVRNPATETEHFARVKVPQLFPRFLAVDARGRPHDPSAMATEVQYSAFVAIEDVIAHFLDRLFPGMEIVKHHVFRVTRNEDLEVEEDDTENLLNALERELLRRRFGPPVRLELASGFPGKLRNMLVRELGITPADVYELPEPIDLSGLTIIADLERPDLQYPPYVPTTAKGLAPVESSQPTDVFAAMAENDVLLHHPYDSFSTSVQQFLAQAAADPQVLAIKQTLYRTSGDSPIVDALIEAAGAGKQVLAIVEIKARFDEQANISWARKLEQAGVHVVYGVVGLKTHCKLSLVVRQEGKRLRRYCHVGTGNYNPKTARLYEDIGVLTVDQQVGRDLTRLFNQLSGYAPKATFERLLVAPNSVRSGLVERIDREIENHCAGKEAWVRFKMNSVVDEETIDALYRASQAGVEVDVIVRGICAIKAGVPNLSENLRVRSILGRYLEHSRIFAFANDGDPDVYIGSADLMHRNLDRRVEVLIQITTPEHVQYLLDVLTRSAAPTTASWHLRHDEQVGQHWVRVHTDDEGEPLEDLQTLLMESSQRTPSA